MIISLVESKEIPLLSNGLFSGNSTYGYDSDMRSEIERATSSMQAGDQVLALRIQAVQVPLI